MVLIPAHLNGAGADNVTFGIVSLFHSPPPPPYRPLPSWDFGPHQHLLEDNLAPAADENAFFLDVVLSRTHETRTLQFLLYVDITGHDWLLGAGTTSDHMLHDMPPRSPDLSPAKYTFSRETGQTLLSEEPTRTVNSHTRAWTQKKHQK